MRESMAKGQELEQMFPEDKFYGAMVLASRDFLFTGDLGSTTDTPEDYVQTMRNAFENLPQARTVLMTALEKCGFKLSPEEVNVTPPKETTPREAIDFRLFQQTWWNVGATVLDMGIEVVYPHERRRNRSRGS